MCWRSLPRAHVSDTKSVRIFQLSPIEVTNAFYESPQWAVFAPKIFPLLEGQSTFLAVGEWGNHPELDVCLLSRRLCQKPWKLAPQIECPRCYCPPYTSHTGLAH